MILSDQTIRELIDTGIIGIDPFNIDNVQPCSLDLTLGSVDGWQVGPDRWLLAPREFILASTLEYVRMPISICGVVAGKSTWARRGLIVESAGFVDAGFEGELTLELFNMSNKVIELNKGEPIAQVVFSFLDKPAEKPYSGKYVAQRGPTPAREKKS